MRNQKLIEGISITATLGAVLAMLLSSYHWPPRIDRPLHRAIGTALAKQALGLLGPQGQILVIARDTEAFPQPAIDVALDSFEREVRRAKSKAATIERLQVDPLRPVEVPPGDFFELIRRVPTGHVIVSLLGPPLLTADQVKRLGTTRPKIVAFCSGSVAEQLDLSRLFDAGLLHAALVSRPMAQQRSGESATPPNTFDQLYVRVTAEDRSLLPPVAATAYP